MALVLAVMAPGIVPFGIDVLNQRFFYAHDDGRMVFYEQVVLSVVASTVALLALAFRPEVAVAVVAVGLVVSNVCSAAFGCGSFDGESVSSGSGKSRSAGSG
jgi:putative peptidoglycan lipid II flippase